VVCADAPTWLRTVPDGSDPDGFDLVFVDPPFADDLWRPTLAALDARCTEDAWLYVESAHGSQAKPGPAWRPHREGRTREVHYALYRRQASAAA
jgi:16S rRNA (guanine966-N2)-methyltransferase